MTAARPDVQTVCLAAEPAAGARMHRSLPLLVIGVCTRQRNALLRRLIDSILNQPCPDGYRVEVVVVDNNDQPMVTTVLPDMLGRFPITAIHEPQIGLVFARNRALDEAASRGADWFIGIDDDEWVAADWLAKLVAGIEDLNRPILIAPCHFIYGQDLSPFVQPWQLPKKPKGARPMVLATSNFAINRRVFDHRFGPGLRFDPAFNESGGEDLEFFLRAERVCGWTAAWLPDAVAFEDWNGARATLRYRLRRSLRNQVSAYHVAQRHRQIGCHGSRIRNLVRNLLLINRNVIYGVSHLLWGLVMLTYRPRQGRHLIGRALERCVRAVAVVPFTIGKMPVAYGARVFAG